MAERREGGRGEGGEAGIWTRGGGGAVIEARRGVSVSSAGRGRSKVWTLGKIIRMDDLIWVLVDLVWDWIADAGVRDLLVE